jgi:hypothetical protein
MLGPFEGDSAFESQTSFGCFLKDSPGSQQFICDRLSERPEGRKGQDAGLRAERAEPVRLGKLVTRKINNKNSN